MFGIKVFFFKLRKETETLMNDEYVEDQKLLHLPNIAVFFCISNSRAENQHYKGVLLFRNQ